MVTIIKLYILFIAINVGWGMLATGVIQASAVEGGQTCPAIGEPFDDNIHHKLCEVGVKFPDELQYDTAQQAEGGINANQQLVEGGAQTVVRNVTLPDGTIFEVLVDPNNNTQTAGGTNEFLSGTFEAFSFIDDIATGANFGASLFLDTFTGGFVLDVLGTDILGVSYPPIFLTGIKILIGISIASYFGFLILSKPLLD